MEILAKQHGVEMEEAYATFAGCVINKRMSHIPLVKSGITTINWHVIEFTAASNVTIQRGRQAHSAMSETFTMILKAWHLIRFDQDGDLIIVSANAGGTNANSIYTVDLATGIAANKRNIISGDWEGIVCALEYPDRQDYGDAHYRYSTRWQQYQ